MAMITPQTLPSIPDTFHTDLRARFLAHFRATCSPPPHSLVYLRGAGLVPRNDSDVDYPFEQQSSFFYLFGVQQQGCEGIIEVDTGRTTLLIERPTQAYLMWMQMLDKHQFMAKYRLDQVLYHTQAQTFFNQYKPSEIHVYEGINSDSKLKSQIPDHPFMDGHTVVKEKLYQAINQCRVVKTEAEIEVLRYVCRRTTESLILTMQNAKEGIRQPQLSALFQFDFSRKTCSLFNGFNPISACCQSISYLHYLNGDRVLKQGDFVLNDMGGRYYGYVADQAITYPVGGVFSPDQRRIYSAVYEAQKAVLESIRQGVDWSEMHLLAESIIIKHLIEMGALKGDPKEIQEKRLGAIFFPHGLGHLFGLLVHDVGGYNTGHPERSDKFGLKSLRTRRTLKSGMAVTVQPGLYFIPFLIEKSRNDPTHLPHMNLQRLAQLTPLGGVRLQDDVVITENGYEPLSFLPRTIEQVQKCYRGEEWS